MNSDQVQLRLNNGAVVDPDDRVCDVVDDREEVILRFSFFCYWKMILINLVIYNCE